MSVQDRGTIEPTTEAERAAISASWKVVMEDFENAGLQILDTFFKTYPGAKPFFPKMKNLDSVEALAGSADARWHVERIMLAVKYAVEHVKDRERLSNKFVPLSDLAIKHGVTDPQYFKYLGQTILKEVEKRNGALSPEAVSGWAKLLSIICIMLTSKYSVSSSLCSTTYNT